MSEVPARIALISALAQSPAPAMAAMKDLWPEARAYNLIDDSLADDLAAAGTITPAIFERFVKLGRYAANAQDDRGPTTGILFTCSAFCPAIDRVKRDLAIPVLTPNEAAFEDALDIAASATGGGRVGLLLTFGGSIAPLTEELSVIAHARGQSVPVIVSSVAEGALAALQRGEATEHDRLVAATAVLMPSVDVVVLGQFSMARAAPAVTACRRGAILTTPGSAVRKLRRLIMEKATPVSQSSL